MHIAATSVLPDRGSGGLVGGANAAGAGVETRVRPGG